MLAVSGEGSKGKVGGLRQRAISPERGRELDPLPAIRGARSRGKEFSRPGRRGTSIRNYRMSGDRARSARRSGCRSSRIRRRDRSSPPSPPDARRLPSRGARPPPPRSTARRSPPPSPDSRRQPPSLPTARSSPPPSADARRAARSPRRGACALFMDGLRLSHVGREASPGSFATVAKDRIQLLGRRATVAARSGRLSGRRAIGVNPISGTCSDSAVRRVRPLVWAPFPEPMEAEPLHQSQVLFVPLRHLVRPVMKADVALHRGRRDRDRASRGRPPPRGRPDERSAAGRGGTGTPGPRRWWGAAGARRRGVRRRHGRRGRQARCRRQHDGGGDLPRSREGGGRGFAGGCAAIRRSSGSSGTVSASTLRGDGPNRIVVDERQSGRACQLPGPSQSGPAAGFETVTGEGALEAEHRLPNTVRLPCHTNVRRRRVAS